MEGDGKRDNMDSPANSEQTVSDDDEIDYTTEPEFYDPELDNKDEVWIDKKRQGRESDAVLSCPACFTTLCLECQRHEKYLTQYRAVFVVNCKVEDKQVLKLNISRSRKKVEAPKGLMGAMHFRLVMKHSNKCAEVGVIDEDEVYHFFNVLPSES